MKFPKSWFKVSQAAFQVDWKGDRVRTDDTTQDLTEGEDDCSKGCDGSNEGKGQTDCRIKKATAEEKAKGQASRETRVKNVRELK